MVDYILIRSTIKSLKSRASQHNGVSSRTGFLIKTGHSGIRYYANKSCLISIDISKFTILDRISEEYNQRLLESMCKNNNDTAVPLNILNNL